jgi:hypothetical protein
VMQQRGMHKLRMTLSMLPARHRILYKSERNWALGL